MLAALSSHATGVSAATHLKFVPAGYADRHFERRRFYFALISVQMRLSSRRCAGVMSFSISSFLDVCSSGKMAEICLISGLMYCRASRLGLPDPIMLVRSAE